MTLRVLTTALHNDQLYIFSASFVRQALGLTTDMEFHDGGAGEASGLMTVNPSAWSTVTSPRSAQ